MSKRAVVGVALLFAVLGVIAMRVIASGGGAERGAGRPGGGVDRFGTGSDPAVMRLDRFEAATHREAHPVQKDGPLRFAESLPVAVSPATHGRWETTDGVARWRLKIEAPGALNLNFGFARYALPPGATLEFRSAEGDLLMRPFTAGDNEEHGQLWTPVMAGGEVDMTLTVAVKDREAVELTLDSINRGFREVRFAAGYEKIGSGSPAGTCHIDVVCSAAESGVGSAIDFYRDQIRSAGVYTLSGVDTCSGAAVNNVRKDGRPYFLTANHCGVRAGNAPSMVVYWNFENSTCRTPGSGAAGGNGDGPVTEFNTGAVFRATYAAADATLVELDDPLEPEHGVFLAGWSRSGTPSLTACVHHPATSEKRISFDFDPSQSTADSGTAPSPTGTHWRVVDWDFGSTEGGSSGSPLFDQDGRLVGQLSGGFAACGNNDSDWFGKFAQAWTGGGSPASALSTWLDPDGTGALAIDGFDPSRAAIRIADAQVAEGNSGTVNLEFAVTLSEAADEVIELTWSTVDGEAVGGSDFTAVTGAPLSFAVGERSKVVAVEINGDTDPEENEEFVVSLALVGNPAAYLLDAQATGTITNDDFIPPVVTGPASVNGFVSEAMAVMVEAQNTPTGFTLSGEPVGMTIEAGGMMRWVPSGVGSYAVTVTASNPAGSGSAVITFEIGANSLAEGLDLPAGLALRSGGAVPWRRSSSANAVQGGDEARSGSIVDDQSSWIEVQVEGPDYLGFWWSVSSEKGYDVLVFDLDGTQRASISGTQDWNYHVAAIPAGSHAARWTYRKDGSESAGADEGRVDFIQLASRSIPFLMESPRLHVLADVGLDYQFPTFRPGAVFGALTLSNGAALNPAGEWSGIPAGPGGDEFDLRVEQDGVQMTVPASLTRGPASPVGAAVNQPGLVWVVAGDDDAEWYAQSSVSRDGEAAKERNVDHGEEAEMAVYTFGPGEISFWWKVSSEEGYDGLVLEIDGEFQDALSGEVDWELKTLSLPYGRHRVSWFYVKDDTISEGLDTAWVDQVEFAGYTGWAMAAGIGTRTNVVFDPDRDGQRLLFEYAMGGSATEWDPMPVPVLVDGLLEWAVEKPPGVTGVALDAEVSGDLIGWNRTERTILQDDAAGFRARDEAGGDGPRFIRGTVHSAE